MVHRYDNWLESVLINSYASKLTLIRDRVVARVSTVLVRVWVRARVRVKDGAVV